jgi:hypothetical protein
MTIHLNKFIDRVQGQDARGSRDFVMTMAEAKNLHADLTRLLLELRDLREQSKPQETPVIAVRLEGGSF